MVALRRRSDVLVDVADGLSAEAVIVAFGHAGAGQGWVRDIAALVPATVGIAAVTTRAASEPKAPGEAGSVEELARRVALELVRFIRSGQRVAFYGQSLGAIVAFETARCVEVSASWDPRVLVAVAAPAPTVTNPIGLRDSTRSDDELFEALLDLGVPARLLSDTRLCERLLRALRADLLLFEQYPWGNDRVTTVPLVVVRSRDDPYVSRADAELWCRASAWHYAQMVEIVGGHIPSGETLARCVAPAVATISSRRDA